MVNKLSELLNQADLEKIEEVDLSQYELSEEELESLHTRVVNKCLGKKKTIKRRLRGSIIAAAIIVASLSSFVYGMQHNWFESIFKSKSSNLSDESKLIINKECTKENIKVSLRGIWGDDSQLMVMYDIEKTDQIPFKGNKLFIEGSINIMNNNHEEMFPLGMTLLEASQDGTRRTYVAYLSNFERPYEVWITDDEKGTEKMVTLNPIDSFTGNEATFNIESITESYMGEDKPLIQLVDYAKEIPDSDTIPFDEVQEEKFGKPEIHEPRPELGMYEYEQIIPTKLLPKGNLDLQIFDKKPGWVIDNIGFIEGNLHIRLIGKGPADTGKALISTDYNDIFSLGSKSEGSEGKLKFLQPLYWGEYYGKDYIEDYMIYKISNVKELETYQMNNSISLDYDTTKAQWQIPFKTDISCDYQEVNSELMIHGLAEGRTWTIDKIRLSNIHIEIKLKGHGNIPAEETYYPDGSWKKEINEDRRGLADTVKIWLEDGEEVQLVPRIERDYREDEFILNFIYMKGIDYTKISTIEINGVKIPIK